MMNGAYRIFKNGEEVYYSPNLVTTFGKDVLIKFLCGTLNNWADSLAIGIGTTAAAVSDANLNFEVARNAVKLRSPNISTVSTTTSGSAGSGTYTFVVSSATGIVVGMAVSGTNINSNAVVTNINSTTITVSHAHTGTVSTSTSVTFTLRKIILKTTLEPSLVATINEVGLFTGQRGSNPGNYDNKIISKFDESVNGSTETNAYNWLYNSAVTQVNSTSKVGTYNVSVNNTSTVLGSQSSTPTAPGTLNIDLTRFNRLDTMQLAIYSTSSTTGTITITLYDNQATPGTLTWSISSATYGATTTTLLSNQLANLTNSGNFNYIVTAIKIATTANIAFDCLKIEETSANNSLYGLVSRSVLGSPITKNIGDSLDIQYELNLGL